jgi:hypothetical protein
MRFLHLAVWLAATAGCSSTTGGGSSTGGPEGSTGANGLFFQPQSTLFATQSPLTEIYMWSSAGFCGFAGSGASETYPFPSASSGVEIQIDHVVTGPETIQIGMGANVSTYVISSSCGMTEGPAIQTGTVTITSVSSGQLAGSLQVSQDSGNGSMQEATGTFTAASCPALLQQLPTGGSWQ